MGLRCGGGGEGCGDGPRLAPFHVYFLLSHPADPVFLFLLRILLDESQAFNVCTHLDGPRGAGGGREPLPSRVEGSMGRRYHACSTGRREHAARNRGDRYQRQAPKPRSVRHPKQAQMQMEPGSVPCGGRRVEVRMPMRRAGSRGVLAMRRRYAKADTATPCGYRYAVRVTGQASSCAHILSHPLSATCRPVCRAAGLSEQS